MIPFKNQFIEDAAKEAFARKGKYQLKMKHPNTGEEVRMWFDTPPTKEIAAAAYESLKGTHQQNSDSITKPYKKAPEKTAMSSKELAGEPKRGTTVPDEYKSGSLINTKNTVLAARGKITWAEAYKRDLPLLARRQTEDMILDEGTKQFEQSVDNVYGNPLVRAALGPTGNFTAPAQKMLIKGLNPIPNRDPIQAYTNLVLEVALPAIGVGVGKALKAVLSRGAKSVDEIAEALIKDGVPEAEVAKIGVEWQKPKTIGDVVEPAGSDGLTPAGNASPSATRTTQKGGGFEPPASPSQLVPEYPKTIGDVVDPELAAAKKGMEGRQPRTAPKATFTPREDPNYDPGQPLDLVGMGQKPKTIGDVGEPKVEPKQKEPWEMTRDEYEDWLAGPTNGDWYVTPDGKFGQMRGSGGMGSNRVGIYDVNGKFYGSYNREELRLAHKTPRTNTATDAADKWLSDVSSRVQKLKADNEGLLLNKGVTDRFRNAVKSGKVTQSQYDAALKKGTVLADDEYAKAISIEQQIEEARSTQLVVKENPQHRRKVEQALSEGKRVPDNVVDEFLADGGKLPKKVHPEIQAKFGSNKPQVQKELKTPDQSNEYTEFLERHDAARKDAANTVARTGPVTQEGKIKSAAEKFANLTSKDASVVRAIFDWRSRPTGGPVTSLSHHLSSSGDSIAKKLGYSDWSEMIEVFRSLPEVLEDVPPKSKPKFGRLGGEKGEGKIGQMSNGETWWTDTHQAYAGNPPKGFNAGTPVSPGGMDRVIQQISDTVPANIVGYTKLDNNVVIRSVDDVNMVIDGRYIAMANAQLGDNLEFRMSPGKLGATKPVLILKDGKRVGVIMPIQASDAVRRFEPSTKIIPKSTISQAAEGARAELADAAKGLEKARKGTKRTKRSGSAYQPLNEAEITYFKAWVKSKGLDAAESVEEFVKHMADEFGDHADSIRWAVKNYLDETKPKAAVSRGSNRADRVKQAEELGTPMPKTVKGETLKELEAKGKKDIAEGYDAPANLARLAEGNLAANEREIAAFTAYRAELLDELRALDKKLDGDLPSEIREAVKLQKDELFGKIEEFDGHLDNVKGTAGRTLGALRIGQTVNWSDLNEIKLEAKRATGVELSDRKIKQIETELEAQKKLVQSRDAKIKELESAKADEVVSQVFRQRRGTKNLDQIRSERKKALENIQAKLREGRQTIGSSPVQGVFEVDWKAIADDVMVVLRSYVDEYKFRTTKELSTQLAKDFPELGATEDDVRRVLAGMWDESTTRPRSDWQVTRAEAKKVVGRQQKLQELEGQLRTGITVVPTKRTVKLSEEAEMLDLRLRVLQKRVKAMAQEKDQTLLQKGAREVFGTFRLFRLGADFGAVLRQGLYGLSRPKQYGKSLVNSMKGLGSDEALFKIEESYLKKTHNGKLLETIRKRAGLSTSDILSDPEEAFVAKWIHKIPGMKKLERGQSAFLNSLRRELMDSFIINTPDATLKELQDRARFINNLTGRSNLKQVHEVLSVIMTSPRYTASRWGMLGEVIRNPANLKSKGARANVQDMAVAAAGVYSILKMAEMGGLEVDFDPLSSDFLKIRDGDTVYDPTAGMATVLRTTIGTALMLKNPELQTPYKNPVANLGKIAVNTASPGVRAPIEQTTGKTLTGFDVDEDEKGWKAFAPIIVSQFWSAIERGDKPEKVATQTAAEFLGVGVSRYPKSPAKKP